MLNNIFTVKFITRHATFFLLLILATTFFLRVYRLNYPTGYVFDEVYHGFTAREYLHGSRNAWDPWAKPPQGVAYEWSHPPLAKEIMTISLWLLHTEDSWGYRASGVLFGVLAVYLTYVITEKLFDRKLLSLLSAFLFSIDGLNFVQSRTGMNDIYFVTFMLLSVYLFFDQRYLFSALALGLSIASKWTGIYMLAPFFLLLLLQKRPLRFGWYLVLVPLVYVATYIPYFLLNFSWSDFIELQKQMWWYHTSLKATHDYASPWWSWPFNLYPVWYFVDYPPNEKIANIFASGNPLLFWLGFLSLLVTARDAIKQRSIKLFSILLMYSCFILPWAFSPRIMFLYHYSPAVPFLSMSLGFQLYKIGLLKGGKPILIAILLAIVLSFVFVFPMLTGVPLSRDLMQLFFYTNITKDPFGRP
jgi:dolichyl-phosphate-mannose-protein mannosyltransferase